MKRSALSLIAVCLQTASIAIAEPCGSDPDAPMPDRRYIQIQDGTVLDTRTGLLWKACAEGAAGLGCADGSSDRFRWQGALHRARDSRFAGHSDWRLPSRHELLSLLQSRCYGLEIDGVNFPNTPPERFWTSTPATYYPGSAWTVHFADGSIGYGTKQDSAYVRLVRDSDACTPARPENCQSDEDRLYDPHGSVDELPPGEDAPQSEEPAGRVH